MTDGGLQSLAKQYTDILDDYLRDHSEAALAQGFDVARRALRDGRGVLDMVLIHHQSLRRLLTEAQLSEETLAEAGDFFVECLSPFEMSHRGAEEGRRALRRLNEILEAELKRIAHALHDEAGQLLASVYIALADVASELPPKLKKRFHDIEQLLTQIETELRGLSHELRPTILDNLGLMPALEFLAEKVSKRTGVNVVVAGETDRRLPPAVETALYRIVQEALNNAVKHAKAKQVKIEVESAPSQVLCRVCDDGVGFTAQGEPGAQGLGLMGIRERLNALGGSLRVATAPGRGTTIFADIPLGGSI